MSEPAVSGRGGFRTDLGFVLAAAGSAVGLGNIWKFPYITGVYGGGAFVLIYLACIALVGLPLLYAEMIIGRRGGKDVLDSMRTLTADAGLAGVLATWGVGLLSVGSGFFILSFYAVVAGWAVHFTILSLGLASPDPTGSAATFTQLAGNGSLSAVWHTAFMGLVVWVVARGVQSGIERACKILMPALMGILLLLLVYVGVTGGLGNSLTFLFEPDFSKVSGEAILEALGHAFFTLSLGMGAMVTYGSYLQSDRHVVRDQLAVAFLDTTIALVAGLVIFAVVFSMGAEAGAGPGLVFITLPDLFAQIPGGSLVSVAFFVLLVLAAWSSGISLLEVVVAVGVDRFGWDRRTAAIGVGIAIWALGVPSAFSDEFLDFMDRLTTRYMLPTGGLLIALSAGWLLPKEDREAGFTAMPGGGALMAAGWTWIIRFVTPILVLLVILNGMGVFG